MNSVTFVDSKPETKFFQGLFLILKKYFSLTKPRIVILLSITGLGGFFIASLTYHIHFDLIQLISALYMGYASAGGAMVINSYFDRDIDILMERTSKRPTVGENSIEPPEKVIVFGGLLVASALIVGYLEFNLLTSLLLSWGVFFYLLGYTLYLKRKSILNNIIGGLASPTPVWVGYAALLGYVPLYGWLLGFLVFIWTPSHTWALASKYYEDYRRAKLPVLTAVYGLEKTALFSFLLGILVLIYSTILIYLMASNPFFAYILLFIPDLIFFVMLYNFWHQPSIKTANTCFKTHNVWLAIAFMIILFFTF